MKYIKLVPIVLLVWAAGAIVAIMVNGRLGLEPRFTWAHLCAASCVGSLIDYILFFRKRTDGKTGGPDRAARNHRRAHEEALR